MPLKHSFHWNERQHLDLPHDERGIVLEKTRHYLENKGNRVIRQSAKKIGGRWLVKIELVPHPSFSLDVDGVFENIEMQLIDRRRGLGMRRSRT